MTAKRQLLESFSKLLTTQIPILSGYDAEREVIFQIRNIIENCVVIPKSKIDSASRIKSQEHEIGGMKYTTYEKRITACSSIRAQTEEIKFMEQVEINDRLLRDLCAFLESEDLK